MEGEDVEEEEEEEAEQAEEEELAEEEEEEEEAEVSEEEAEVVEEEEEPALRADRVTDAHASPNLASTPAGGGCKPRAWSMSPGRAPLRRFSATTKVGVRGPGARTRPLTRGPQRPRSSTRTCRSASAWRSWRRS